MATYNGARYLGEQLDSLARQTRLPDQLIVTDDGSRDGTVELVRNFARTAPFSVEVHVNNRNLGYARNFGRAISLCRGDLIFLSDQDDVWLEHKIERIENVFLSRQDVMVVLHDAEIVDSLLRSTGRSKKSQARALGMAPDAFVNGCCSAFRASFNTLLVPIPYQCFTHDAWLHRLASILGVRHFMDASMISYRRHGESVSQWAGNSLRAARGMGLREGLAQDPRGWFTHRVAQLKVLEQRLRESPVPAMEQLGLEARRTVALSAIAAERRALKNRLHLLGQARYRRILAAAAMYMQGDYAHFSGWKSLAKDLVKR